MTEANQQPASRDANAETAELLQETIQRLEAVLERLRTQSGEQLPPPSLQTLVASSEELVASLEAESIAAPLEEKAIAQSPAPQEASAPEPPPVEETTQPSVVRAPKPEPSPVEETTQPSVVRSPKPEPPPQEPQAPTPPPPQLTDRVLPSFAHLETWWDGILNAVRSLLPASIRGIPNWALTGILTGTLVAIIISSVFLLPKQPQQEIGEVPSQTLTEIETPPRLKAPAEEQPIKTSPPPMPKLELTPEQSLIAAIQTQVSQITDRYTEGLIQTIEANFAGSRLIVQVGNNWYELEDSQQNKLANEMLRRSQEVDFRKLEITDPQGTLLARSPVVGQEMVILQRHN